MLDIVEVWKEKELVRSLDYYKDLLKSYNELLDETKMAVSYWNDRQYFIDYKGMTREECTAEHDRLYGIQKQFMRYHSTAMSLLKEFIVKDAEKCGYRTYATVKDEKYNLTHEYKYFIAQYKIDEEKATRVLKKAIDRHFEALQGKVEKKIGTIERIASLGGDDYRFEGTLGSCNVRVILAGGYNIQKLHTRWIITGVVLKDGE